VRLGPALLAVLVAGAALVALRARDGAERSRTVHDAEPLPTAATGPVLAGLAPAKSLAPLPRLLDLLEGGPEESLAVAARATEAMAGNGFAAWRGADGPPPAERVRDALRPVLDAIEDAASSRASR
jgi:hypothetical protein